MLQKGIKKQHESRGQKEEEEDEARPMGKLLGVLNYAGVDNRYELAPKRLGCRNEGAALAVQKGQ